MSSTELVKVTNPDEIAAMPDEQRGALITAALEESKSWLAVATTGSDPTPITEFRAWAATVAEMTRAKGLAEEIQLDALEMVRRAERGIGLTIRNAQAKGEVTRRGMNYGWRVTEYQRRSAVTGEIETVKLSDRAAVQDPQKNLYSPAQYFTTATERVQAYRMTDNVTDEQFDEALDQARADRNLSRKNVVRKIETGSDLPVARSAKADKIRELAPTGRTSKQIAPLIGISDITVRDIAREYEIEIPGDRATLRSQSKVNPERIVGSTINTLEAMQFTLSMLEPHHFTQLDPADVKRWADSLVLSLRTLNRLRKELNRHADQD